MYISAHILFIMPLLLRFHLWYACMYICYRCIAPVLFGAIFSLSLSETTLKIGFPLNYNLVFVCFSLTYVACIFLVASLPTSINKQKIIEDE